MYQSACMMSSNCQLDTYLLSQKGTLLKALMGDYQSHWSEIPLKYVVKNMQPKNLKNSDIVSCWFFVAIRLTFV